MDAAKTHLMEPNRQTLTSERISHLRDLATSLEASFISEMLNHAGLGKPRDSFNGGVGEDHFSSFFTQEISNSISHANGFGIADSIFDALVANEEK